MKRLIVMLGKGQAKILGKEDISYNPADYFIPNTDKKPVHTPFLGYALAKLVPEYDVIHILGTESSQWVGLLYFLIENSINSAELEFLEKVIYSFENKTFFNDHVLIKDYEKILKKYLGITAKIHVIPIGKNEQELWKIFEEIAEIPKDEDIISLDITHGLRYQPFLVTLAFNYFQNIRKNVILKDVFYGALELSSMYQNLTPILNLNNLLILSKWIDAVKSFSDYGDIRALNDLLTSAPDLKNKINKFSYYLNLNGAKKIRESAESLVNAIKNLRINDPNLTPLKFVKDALMEVPKRILNITTDWELFLYLAEKNWENGQYVLSVLETYQAILARVGDLTNRDSFHNEDNSKEVGSLAKKIKKIKKYVVKINKYRILAAHSDLGLSQTIDELVVEFPRLLKEITPLLKELSYDDIKLKKRVCLS